MPGGLRELRSTIHNKTALLASAGRSFQSALGVGGTACELPGQMLPGAGGDAAHASPVWLGGPKPRKGPSRSDVAAGAQPLLEAAARGAAGGGARGVCGVPAAAGTAASGSRGVEEGGGQGAGVDSPHCSRAACPEPAVRFIFPFRTPSFCSLPPDRRAAAAVICGLLSKRCSSGCWLRLIRINLALNGS